MAPPKVTRTDDPRGRPPTEGTLNTGRPPRRSVNLLIRFTEEEHRLLLMAARRAGLGLGPWLRSLGMREARLLAEPQQTSTNPDGRTA